MEISFTFHSFNFVMPHCPTANESNFTVDFNADSVILSKTYLFKFKFIIRIYPGFNSA